MKGVKTKPHTIVASSSLLNKDYTKEEGDYPTLGGSPAKQLTHGLRRLFSHKHEALLLDFSIKILKQLIMKGYLILIAIKK